MEGAKGRSRQGPGLLLLALQSSTGERKWLYRAIALWVASSLTRARPRGVACGAELTGSDRPWGTRGLHRRQVTHFFLQGLHQGIEGLDKLVDAFFE